MPIIIAVFAALLAIYLIATGIYFLITFFAIVFASWIFWILVIIISVIWISILVHSRY